MIAKINIFLDKNCDLLFHSVLFLLKLSFSLLKIITVIIIDCVIMMRYLMVLFYSCRHCRTNKFSLALGIGYPTVWAAEKRNIAISMSIYHILSSSTIVS